MTVDLLICIMVDSNQNGLKKDPLFHISVQKYRKT